MPASFVAAQETRAASFHRAGAAGLRLDVAILLAFSVFFTVLRWCALDSFWGDSPRWIFEAYRGSLGELPYRDFAWQYPPLALFVFSGAMRLFGQTFATVQALLDVVSAAVVMLTWDVARRWLPRPLPVLIALALACAGASNSSNFALFSLQIYTPAMLVGMIGLLLFLREAVDYIRTGQWNKRGCMWASLGAAIGLLSKPEFMVGVTACLAALSLSDRQLHFRTRTLSEWAGYYAKLWVAALGPALCIYAGLAMLCGAGNLLAGIGGYGLAKLTCPWWPTGLGVFGAVVALGQAVVIAALFSLTRLEAFRRRYGTRYRWLWIMAGIAVILTVLYLPYCAREIPIFQGRLTALHTVAYFLSTGTILLPVMWVSIVLWLGCAQRLYQAFRGRERWTGSDSLTFTFFTGAVCMSLRGLFSGTMSQLSLASNAAYPVWFLVGPYLLMRFLEAPCGDDAGSQERMASRPAPVKAAWLVAALVAGFALLRLGGVVVGEWRQSYVKLSTPAGSVRVKDKSISPPAREYVATHTVPGDLVLDLAFGGGLNFTERRASPIFSTQFTALAPAPKYLALDLERIRKHPPRLVIANAGPDFQASYGVCLDTGCTFPRLVWRSTRPACNPAVTFPALEYIRQNYEPRIQFGDKIVYAQKTAALAAVLPAHVKPAR